MTTDPLYDFAMWDDEQEDKLSQRPICSECQEHIQDEAYYEIDGHYYCPSCVKANKQYF